MQPKTVSMGPLIAGQRGTQTLTIGGMHGERVSGTIVSHSPWLVVDRRDFDGMVEVVVALLQRLDAAEVARLRDFTPGG